MSVLTALSLIASRQAGVDLLDPGIVFNGPVTFARDTKSNTTSFFVHDGDSRVLVKVDTERAFSAIENNTISYEWAQLLARAQTASIRIADSSAPDGSLIRHDSVERVVKCLGPTPQRRTATEIIYALQCVAFDEHWRRNAAGDILVGEISIGVSVPNQSAADTFLSKQRDAILVRLELPK